MLSILLNNFFIWTNIVLVLIFILYQLIVNKKYDIKEFFIQLSITIVFIFSAMSAFFYFGTDLMQKEILNGHVKEFVYEEPWTESYDCSYESCSTDSKGKQHCHTVHKTCTTRHRANYFILNSTNNKIHINSLNFKNAQYDFGVHEIDTYRSGQTSMSKMAGEGDIWKSIPIRIIPTAETHTYSNYLIGSENTIRKHSGKVLYEIESYPYPKESKYGCISLKRVLGVYEPTLDIKMAILANSVGEDKQINPLIYIVSSDKKDFKESLMISWKSGQKNDSVLILGVDKNGSISWSDNLNWSSNQRFGIEMERNFDNLNIYSDQNIIVSTYKDIIMKYWTRLSMEDTYGYLKYEIDIPIYLQLILILLNLILNFFIFRYFNKF